MTEETISLTILRALVLCSYGDHREAICRLQQNPRMVEVIEQIQETSPQFSEERLFLVLGDWLRMADDIPIAIKLLKQSVAYAETIPDKVLLSDSLHSLEVLYKENFQDYPSAKQYYEQGLELRHHLNDDARLASSLHELGIVEQFMSQLDRAMERFEQSLRLSTGVKDLDQVANTLAQIGRIYQQQGESRWAMVIYLIVHHFMTEVQSPNTQIVQNWMTQMNLQLSSRDEFEAILHALPEHAALELLENIEYCRLCKRPIHPQYASSIVMGQWCHQPENHASEFVAALNEFISHLDLPPGVTVYFDYDAWHRYEAWKDSMPQQTRQTFRATLTDVERFFDVERTPEMTSPVVKIWRD